MIDYDKSMYSEEEFGETPTLRDQFAMAALQGMMSSPLGEDESWSCRFLANSSYELADAMMEARNK